MPEVNFNLLNPGAELYSGPQVTLDPVKAYETAQAKQQSNMLAQLYAKHYDPQTGGVNYNSLIGEAAQSGLGKYIPDIMGDAQKQAQSQATVEHNRRLAEQEAATAAAKQQEMFDAGVKSSMTYSRSQLDNIKTPEEYLKWHEANHADPYLSKYFASHGINKEDRRAEINSLLSQEGGLKTLIEQSKKGFDSILGTKPVEQKQFQPTAAEVEYNLWKSDPAAYERFKRAQEGPKASATSTTKEPDATGLTVAERNKREAAYPKAKLSFTNASSDIDTLVSDLKTLKSHKGLSGITGLVYGRTPGITGEARAAEALLEKILSRGQFRSLQELRNNSPTGGAVGNVSDFEGRALRSSFGALDRKQDTSDFQSAIDDVINQLESSKVNLSAAFDDTYSYRSGSAAAPAAATPSAKTDGNAAKIKQLEDLIAKEPNNPRIGEAKALLKKLKSGG